MKANLLPIALLVIMLAGCAESAPPNQAAVEEEQPFETLETKATETTGVIRGLVLTQAIVPIVGADIRIINLELSAVSNEEGAFAFSDIDAGVYFLEISKAGYNSTQTSVTVEAGVDKPAITKVILAADPGGFPYYEDQQWTGYYTCSTAAFQVCPFIDSMLCIAGQCDYMDDAFIVTVPIAQPPTWINSELVWKSTQAAGEELDFYLETVAKDNPSSWNTRNSNFEGPSPVLITVDEETATGYEYGTTNDMRHRVFPAIGATTLVMLDQTFDVYSHVFYNYAPPEGWQFSRDSNVPPPPA